MSFIFHPDGSVPTARLGGKAGALAALHGAGMPIPPWFALLPDAFDASLTDLARQQLKSAHSSKEIASILAEVQLAPAIRETLTQALAELCPEHQRVAVRSSGHDEDGTNVSFAGQLESYLFVAPDDVPQRVMAVWRSAFSEQLNAYRLRHGLTSEFRAPAVIVQRMLDPEIAGVAFSADPVTGRRGVVVVSAVFGLGTGLVAGENNSDTWRVDRDRQIIQREIANKREAYRFDASSPAGFSSTNVPEAKARLPSLHDNEIRAVASLARQASRTFGCPQDIEWGIERGTLYLLQSRPITSLREMADPDGRLNIWDNSNITESYSGVTTPLTFSFARHAYEGVYRQFCRILAVPKTALAAHDDTFREMIGLIRGRVYYNLLSWYRILALLPGFAVNRRFMEQMMGVKEGLPEEIVAELSLANWTDRFKDGVRLAVTTGGLVLNHFRLPGRIEGFYRRLNMALSTPKPPLEERRPDELVAYYRGLEKQLLRRWDAPLLNDFFAMIFYGVLRKLVEKWCRDADGTLQNSLLCGEGGMISAEPAQRLREMAEIAARHPEFVTLLCDGTLAAIQYAVEQQPHFKSRFADYLQKFGDRCLEELKLESIPLQDDPLVLLRSVGNLARSFVAAPVQTRSDLSQESGPQEANRAFTGAVTKDGSSRSRAELRVSQDLRGHPIKRSVFNWVLRQARARVRDRENLRFERTRLFGRVRRIFIELGRRLHAMGLIETPRDIFYLEVDETLGVVAGTNSTTDLRGLVAVRKSEFAGYRQGEAPPNRFETRGPVHHGNAFQAKPSDVIPVGDYRKGIGCCPGIVRGAVQLIADPHRATMRSGEILVAERTDPGWIMFFPAASGLLVERGSLLSHSAIVARELGIPAVVAIDGLMQWLKDGDVVELDGTSGVVRRVVSPPEPPPPR